MKRIENFKLAGIIFSVFILNFLFSCEEQATSEITANEVENQVVEISESGKNQNLEQQTFQWCVFGNYCDSTGRHYPAKFQVSIWNYREGEKQEQLITNRSNEVELNEAGDYAGTTLCLELANAPGRDEYFVEIIILSSEAYGEISETIIREGVLDEIEIKNLYRGEANVDYFHFREGCDSFDTPNLFPN